MSSFSSETQTDTVSEMFDNLDGTFVTARIFDSYTVSNTGVKSASLKMKEKPSSEAYIPNPFFSSMTDYSLPVDNLSV